MIYYKVAIVVLISAILFYMYNQLDNLSVQQRRLENRCLQLESTVKRQNVDMAGIRTLSVPKPMNSYPSMIRNVPSMPNPVSIPKPVNKPITQTQISAQDKGLQNPQINVRRIEISSVRDGQVESISEEETEDHIATYSNEKLTEPKANLEKIDQDLKETKPLQNLVEEDFLETEPIASTVVESTESENHIQLEYDDVEDDVIENGLAQLQQKLQDIVVPEIKVAVEKPVEEPVAPVEDPEEEPEDTEPTEEISDTSSPDMYGAKIQMTDSEPQESVKEDKVKEESVKEDTVNEESVKEESETKTLKITKLKRMKLAELQQIAQDYEIEIMKQVNGEDRPKTRRELYSEIYKSK